MRAGEQGEAHMEFERVGADIEFTVGGERYRVVRYVEPESREGRVALLAMLLDCDEERAAEAYDIVFGAPYLDDEMEDQRADPRDATSEAETPHGDQA